MTIRVPAVSLLLLLRRVATQNAGVDVKPTSLKPAVWPMCLIQLRWARKLALPENEGSPPR